jgi:hypothetical protein
LLIVLAERLADDEIAPPSDINKIDQGGWFITPPKSILDSGIIVYFRNADVPLPKLTQELVY